MKLFAALLLLVSTNVFADDAQVLRVFDGATATCKNKEDQARYKNGAYRVRDAKVSITVTNEKQTAVKVKLVVDSFKCVRTFTGFSFQPLNMLDDRKYFALDGSLTTIEVLDARLKGTVDGIYDLIMEKALSNKSSQAVSFTVPMDQIPRIQGKFQIDLWLSQKVRITNEDRQYDETENLAFGTYRLRF